MKLRSFSNRPSLDATPEPRLRHAAHTRSLDPPRQGCHHYTRIEMHQSKSISRDGTGQTSVAMSRVCESVGPTYRSRPKDYPVIQENACRAVDMLIKPQDNQSGRVYAAWKAMRQVSRAQHIMGDFLVR
ncbi:hypothetical protein BDW42DRAFT_162679 [Aspergillus taichungensis]|uniref:Uncharacterized protein n=1 Tax=Aspergillus taichungensis TaxID=482145 RepID=A0A2J5I3N2_9EURO|nr:hypothetical protein BDW42DRAFT_162679 [Aspergillus taichungensis]